MADSFFAGGGAIVALKLDDKATPIYIDGVFDEYGRLSTNASRDSGCIYGYVVTGITYQDTDIITPVAAIDQSRVLYTAGQNFGEFALEGIAFFSNLGNPLTELETSFSKGRVSVDQSPKTVTGLNLQNLKVFVHKLNVFGGDPETQSVRFSAECIVAPVSNKRS